MASPPHTTKLLVMPNTGEVVRIDDELFLGVARLNELGITTSFCCQGGSGGGAAYVALADGMQFPSELHQDWAGAGFDVNTCTVYSSAPSSQEPVVAHFLWAHQADRARKGGGMQFSSELLQAWQSTEYRGTAGRFDSESRPDQLDALADSLCRTLDPLVQGKLGATGASYRSLRAGPDTSAVRPAQCRPEPQA